MSIPAAWLVVQRTDAFSAASNYINNSSEVRAQLGEIQDIDLPLFGYNIRMNGAKGHASFDLKLRGKVATGTAFVELAKQGTWYPTTVRLVLGDGTIATIKQ